MVFDPRSRIDGKTFGKVYLTIWLLSKLTDKIITNEALSIALAVVFAVLQILISIARLRDAGKSIVYGILVPIVAFGFLVGSLLLVDSGYLTEGLICLVVSGIIGIVFLIILCRLKSIPVDSCSSFSK